jgi:small conductance mechanosensitive channel
VAPSGEGRFVAALRVVAASVVYGAALLASLWAWRVPLESWLTTPIGLRLLGSALIIGLAALAATAIWEAIGVLIDRHLRRGPGSSAEKLRRRARIETLVPVLRKIVLWMLAAVVVIVVMSELGIDPAPLIAGAGVAGIAIGLGAQSLIKDLVTGISHILEDTFAVGDVVRVGDFSGVVEGISIRAVRLRDTDGAVHTIPFSAVAAVTNLTKEYAFAPLDVGVAYGEDLDRVMATIREVAAGLRADPAFAALLPEEAEILGVDAFQDSSVLVRGRLKTLPGQQWVVAREYRRRLKLAFDAKGIEIPYPQRTVHTRVEVVPPAASD